jgi:hypothetical protein
MLLNKNNRKLLALNLNFGSYLVQSRRKINYWELLTVIKNLPKPNIDKIIKILNTYWSNTEQRDYFILDFYFVGTCYGEKMHFWQTYL